MPASKIYLGSGRDGLVFVTIELRQSDKGTELSIFGETRHSGGQMYDHLLADISQFRVPRQEVEKLVTVWKVWHLNGMRAGCEHQRAEGWDKLPIDPSKPLDAYGKHFPEQRYASWNMLTWVPRSEHPQGLLSQPCPVCGYKYGSAWLHEDLPADVVEFIEGFVRRWKDLTDASLAWGSVR